MEQKIERLEKEQQRLRQEVDSLYEIINILQTKTLNETNKIIEKNFDDFCDIFEISSVSDESSVCNESLINKIEKIMESKLEYFKDSIIETIKSEQISKI